jgi:hypothetical protein
MPSEMPAAIEAKNGFSCPSTTVARYQATLAATAVCKMGHPPPRRRPNASASRRRNSDSLPINLICVSTPVLVANHLLSSVTPREQPLALQPL